MAAEVRQIAEKLVMSTRGALTGAAEACISRGASFDLLAEFDQAYEAWARSEERYERICGLDPGPYGWDANHSFFRDMLDRASDGARFRLGAALAQRERRALAMADSAAGGIFAPPAYLKAAWADIPRPERVLAGLVPSVPLPKGGSFKIPKLTGGVQVSDGPDNSGVDDVDLTSEFITSNLPRIAGKLVTSLQLLDQSSGPAFDFVAGRLLAAAYDANLETQVVSGDGTAGNLLGVVNAGGTGVTYTNASPGGADCYAAIGNAVGTVASARNAHPEAILLHGRRWAWLGSRTDTSGRPLLPPGGPDTAKVAGGTSPVGSLVGVPAYVDPAIPTNLGAGTNQDQIIVCRPSDCLLLEGELQYDVITEAYADSLAVVLRVHASAAFFCDRYPSAVSVVGGTGLATPAY